LAVGDVRRPWRRECEDGDYTVGWFTLALVNAGLAQSRNRGGGIWFLLSLVLGPAATLLLVIRPPAPPGATGSE
jgi:hypothetical protein